MSPATTLLDWLARAAGRDDVGLRFVDRAERESFVSWREVAERARRVAAGLAALGVSGGQVIAIVLPTGADFMAAFFGALAAGAVPAPLYPPARLARRAEYERRTAALAAAAGAVAVLTQPAIAPVLANLAPTPGARWLGVRALDDLPTGEDSPLAAARASDDDLALVQFSSGTTVDPKPVALTHRALVAQIEALNALWPDAPGLRHAGVSWLPLYHDMGLVGCLLPALERPGNLTLLAPETFVARPALWLRAIARHRATISAAPNFAYAHAAERIADADLEGLDLGSWRIALCGAETVVPEVLRRFAARFAPHGFRAEALTPVYGLAEAALAVTFPPLGRAPLARRFARSRLAAGEALAAAAAAPASASVELAALGSPLPGFTLEIRDEDARALPERRIGRVWISGPSLFREYLGQPEATATALVDGFFDTGDLGFVDQGELYVTGRVKDVLIVRGRKHSPVEVELAAGSVAGVRAGAVAAATHRFDESATERLLVWAELERDAAAAAGEEVAAAIAAAVLATTGLAVDRVVALPPGALPRTSSGKIRRQETLRRALAGELRAHSSATE
ncbi:MAG: AMP-binding protein [Thermoanaerobaculia bacterium]